MRGTVSNQNTSRRYDVMASCFDFGLLLPCFRLDFLQTHTKHGWYIQYFSKLSESTQYLVEIEHLGYGPEVAFMPIFEVEKILNAPPQLWTLLLERSFMSPEPHLYKLGNYSPSKVEKSGERLLLANGRKKIRPAVFEVFLEYNCCFWLILWRASRPAGRTEVALLGAQRSLAEGPLAQWTHQRNFLWYKTSFLSLCIACGYRKMGASECKWVHLHSKK